MDCQCTVPEEICTHPMEGHRKLLVGGGLKAKILEGKYEAKLEFPGGREGGVWIFSGTAQKQISKCPKAR